MALEREETGGIPPMQIVENDPILSRFLDEDFDNIR